MEINNSLKLDNQLENMPTEGASQIGPTFTIFGTGNTQAINNTFDIENGIQWNHERKISDFVGENKISDLMEKMKFNMIMS